MYTFAIVALLALGTVKLVDFLADNIDALGRIRSLMTYVVGVGSAVALDYSLFDGFQTTIRNHDLGVWMTGFMVVGMTVPWRAIFTYLTHDRAMADETLGHHSPILRKVA
jgi:hypothetical protein